MPPQRKRSQATSREGINFVRALIERKNCTFQEIDLQNDLGNDAYVEFVVDENATGCCVALQIKSGKSYRTAPGRYAFQSDRSHFEYWATHTLPVLAVVFDPEAQTAFWGDITDHLRLHPGMVTDGPYSVPVTRELSDSSFEEFRQHCLGYRDQFARESHFGDALASFATREDTERCFDGLRALFAYHRQQPATWYYLISCLSNYRDHPVLRALVVRLCHVPGHGDIFWGSRNLITEPTRQAALQFMRERFDRRDALTLLRAIDDAGIQRGSLGQAVHALVDCLSQPVVVLESIAADASQDERVRHSAILLAVSAAQSQSLDTAIALLDRVEPTVQDDDLLNVIAWLRHELQKFHFVSLY
jgi:hypothetical protein